MDINARYISFRTFRRSGAAVDTPGWFASVDPDTHYLFSTADAGKVKRVRNSSTAQMATCDMKGSTLGQWHDCHAYLVADTAESHIAYVLLTRKYGWQMRLLDFFSRLSGRINQRAVIRLESGQ
jgi:PPOX class probable F420-dependent enzyme